MKKHILSFVVLLFCSSVYSQAIVKGVVKNENNHGLENVFIKNLRTLEHAHSNTFGDFSINNCQNGDTLELILLGYQSAYSIINNTSEKLEIKLSTNEFNIKEVIVSGDRDPINYFTNINLNQTPVNNSQEILRQVPGLFIGQHAGGGKAEQIFLRGFDIDHGTDLRIEYDGMPVNMVSHAHGQGYSDMHFIIPELLEKVDFNKGPYDANQGNFATAGNVQLKSKNQLNNNLLSIEKGQFNTERLLGMFQLVNNNAHSAYVAAEFLNTDGPFESSQHFNRINLQGKYTFEKANERISVQLSHFQSEWDASGQIPQRAVDNGSISRFGAIDDTEGGNTSRSNVIIKHDKQLSANSGINSKVYYSYYDFELYSNFTFFLEDSINGDQIRQREERNLFGVGTEYFHKLSLNGNPLLLKAGLDFRQDFSKNNELSHTKNRSEVLDSIQFGDISERNLGAYLAADLELGKLKISPALRVDDFTFQYLDKLNTLYDNQSTRKAVWSPKLNFSYEYSDNLNFYLKNGYGFHSNDSRVILANTSREILPSVLGNDLGLIWKVKNKTLINVAYWQLFSEQEFVYVGDAGIVEPSGKSTRYGFDLSIRHQLLPSLFVSGDANYTIARATEEKLGNDYIPLAPDFTAQAGLYYKNDGFYAGLNMRHIANRPANEDNSLIAEGYTVFDTNLGYSWKKLQFEIQVQNLFDVDWNETQFATESKLRNETESVEEIHFTPGTPFFAKAKIAYQF